MSEKNRIIQSLILFFAIVASLLSMYLLMDHYELSSSTSVFNKLCSVSETLDCNKVNSSRYSSLLGIPVAAYGLLYYVFVAGLMMLRFFSKHRILVDLVKSILFILSSASVLVILPLLYISVFKINALCTFCIMSWACSGVIFLLAIGFVKETDESLLPSLKKSMNHVKQGLIDFSEHKAHLSLFVLSTLLVFISVFSFSGYLYMKAELGKAGMSLNELDKHLSGFYKKEVFDMEIDGIPVAHGDPDAKHTIVLYTDFNCPVCREATPLMDDLARQFKGKLKVVLRNFPLDPVCNPIVTKPKGETGLSCKAALVSIALRKTDGYLAYVNHIMQSDKMLSKALIKSAIDASGVNEGLLMRRLQDERTQKILQKEMKDGFTAGVTSTPSLFLNGRHLGRGLPQKYILDRLIQMELERLRHQ